MMITSATYILIKYYAYGKIKGTMTNTDSEKKGWAMNIKESLQMYLQKNQGKLTEDQEYYESNDI
jgi:hypothetical protein